jgi:MYXO-CTERM domain-containing protein
VLPRRLLLTLSVSVALGSAACAFAPADSNAPDGLGETGETGEPSGSAAPGEPRDSAETVGTVSEALAATAPVSSAVTATCTTTVVKGLATQLVEEIQCMKPGTLTRIDGTSGLSLGSAVFPYLQTPAATALIAAQKARGVKMSINSALRALPQQYLLYRWYKTGRCGISLAATPGTSNHESALALDIQDQAGWRASMLSHGFRWLGASDPVHYDYVGAGRVSLSGLSVKAFQRLWNRNHPGDTIVEDGDYGPATESRLAQAPVGGFAMGANCKKADAGADAGPDDPAAPDDQAVPIVPDADEPASDVPPSDPANATLPPSGERPAAATGCAASPAGAPGALPVFALGAVALLAARRRRRRRRAA